MKTELTDDLLDFRKKSKGKGTMYIIIPNSGEEDEYVRRQNIYIATPKTLFTPEELDGFIKFLLESAEFDGKMVKGKQHNIWKDLVKNSSKRDYYKFLLNDSWIEICPIPLKDITYISPSENA